MKRYFVGVLILAPVALGAAWWLGWHNNDAAATRDLLGRYCTDCHNSVDFTAELVIDPAKVEEIAAAPEHWEKIVRKLREESMPPDGPRPDRAAYLTRSDLSRRRARRGRGGAAEPRRACRRSGG